MSIAVPAALHGSPRSDGQPPRRSRRRLAWVLGGLAVLVLVVGVVVVFTVAARNSAADDPSSSRPNGAEALAQLLRDEGVRITTSRSVADTVGRSTATTTVVVANADRLNAAEADRIARAPHGRLVLLRPGATGLTAFGVGASPAPQVAAEVRAGCTDRSATLAESVLMTDRATFYRSDATPTLACFPVGAGGYGYLRLTAAAGPLDLLAGGTSNDVLATAGNAAFAMNVLGSQPDLVWLMAESSGEATDGGTGAPPGLLPPWWLLAVAQAVLAIAVVAVWRGRRLGPILAEPLPVRIRAAETVEGHGRLYEKIQARDRAAEALRGGVRQRLGRRYGHTDDPRSLAAAVAAHTGRPDREVIDLLDGPAPADDDALVALAHALDALETDAHLT